MIYVTLCEIKAMLSKQLEEQLRQAETGFQMQKRIISIV